jgi:hypothetical protein
MILSPTNIYLELAFWYHEYTLLLQKLLQKYSLWPLIQVPEMLFIDGSKTSPLVTFAPPP